MASTVYSLNFHLEPRVIRHPIPRTLVSKLALGKLSILLLVMFN